MNTYIPTPVNTDGVQLPEDLIILREQIAEHVHDVWAQQRIKDGWQYGWQRDDNAKLHPCLVPYKELTDKEQEYDRQTAEGTLKILLAKGWSIKAPQ